MSAQLLEVNTRKQTPTSRSWKTRNLIAKTKLIIKSVAGDHDKVSFMSLMKFIVSAEGKRLVKKFTLKYLSIILNKDLLAYRQTQSYSRWRKKNMVTSQELQNFASIAHGWSLRPSFAVILVADKSGDAGLVRSIDSVLAQVYPDFQLFVLNKEEYSEKSQVKRLAESDSRIVLKNYRSSFAEAANEIIQSSSVDYITFLAAQDSLRADALYRLADFFHKYKETEVVYSDEEKKDSKGNYSDPMFKSEWCPDTFFSLNYTGRLACYSRNVILRSGNFNKEYETCFDYDLMLRVSEHTSKIRHLAHVLYTRYYDAELEDWSSITYEPATARKALEESLKRRGYPGVVQEEDEERPGVFSIRYQLASEPKVSIIIPSRNQSELLRQCVDSIITLSTYENYEIIIVDNGSYEDAFFDLINYYKKALGPKFKCLHHNIPFNFSKLINYGVQQSSGEYVLLLNNDTKVISEDWLEGMVEQAQRKEVGVVGARLLFPNNTIQHAGVVLKPREMAVHIFACSPTDLYDNIRTRVIGNYAALTGACVMIRKKLMLEVGGFDEELAVEFNDIDFCLRLYDKGYHHVYLPHVTLYHYESVSRGSSRAHKRSYEKYLKESEIFRCRWNKYLENDPCYNMLNSVVLDQE